MPQLNLNPWFIIFTTFWLMFLIKMLLHINKFKLPGNPILQQIHNKLSPWSWPWT
uniref:ATP synthase complex subunit 8 n=1 Tax=Plethodon petraeus TaxID=154587 RepID=Q644S8_9SALA|nr:ATP synthase F0 subunit 8 [Plethodon petraeus]